MCKLGWLPMNEQNRNTLLALGMNIDETLARFMGNEALLFKFLGRIQGDTTYDALKIAMEAGDAKEAFHQAHTLKGVVGNLGLGNLFDAVTPLVETLRSGTIDEARALFPAVEAAQAEVARLLPTLA